MGRAAPTLTDVSTAPPPSRVWLDEGLVDQSWTPPGPAVRTWSPAVVGLVVGLALVLVVALVLGLGGLERRTDVLRDTPVGSTVRTGPYELRFTGATAQQRTGFDDAVTWRVVMTGEGRTTGEESLAPDYAGDHGMFVAKDEASREVQLPQGETFGPGQRIGGRFTPGLPMQPFAVQFDFSPDYRPQERVTFVVYQLELRDSSLLGNQDEQWRNAQQAYRFELPLQVLPAATS